MVWAAAGHADPVIVRSGEHPGFSRLVLDFINVPAWSVSTKGQRHNFAFTDAKLDLDINAVFDRMGRSRIASVEASENSLVLDLACECQVEAYALPGGRLVIDVASQRDSLRTGVATSQVLNSAVVDDSVDQQTDLVELNFDPAAKWATPSIPPLKRIADISFGLEAPKPQTRPVAPVLEPSSGPDGLPDVGNGGGTPPSDLVNQRAQAAPAMALDSPVGLPSPQLGLGELPWAFSEIEEQSRTNTATGALADALQRAAQQGLIELETAPSEAEKPSPPKTSQNRQLADLPLPVGSQSNLRVSTSLDRDLARIARRLEDNSGSDCLSAYDVSVANWGDEQDRFGGLGTLRKSVLGEFDEPDIAAVSALARHYIFLSFGAEAQSVLDAYALPPNDAAVLRFLAEIADGQTRPADDPAARLLNCPGPAALWGMLALAEPPKDGEIASAEIAGAFSELPLHLRRHYGPLLVDRFLAAGDPDTARTVWEAVDRAPGDHGDRFVLATAALAGAEGNTQIAEAAYKTLEGASPANAPRAVVQLLSSQIDRGAQVDPGLVDTAAALAFENQGTAVARTLKVAELRGRIVLSDWDTVFEELPRAQFSGALTQTDIAEILVELYTQLAIRGRTDDFLTWAVKARSRLSSSVEADSARRALAKRFVDIGLVDQADALLLEIVLPEPQDQIIRARSDIKAGRFASAERLLAGIETPQAQTLRGSALAGQGRFAEAVEALAAAGEAERSEQTAARGGLWDLSPSAVQAAAAPLLASESSDPAQPPLARNRTLISSAGSLRDEISALLDITGPPTP